MFFQEAPKDKLLIYDLKKGWEPLCEFLKKKVPTKPFPRKNVGGQDLVPDMELHPLGKQILKETKISFIAVFLFLLMFGCYCYFTNSSIWQTSGTILLGFLALIVFLKI